LFLSRRPTIEPLSIGSTNQNGFVSTSSCCCICACDDLCHHVVFKYCVECSRSTYAWAHIFSIVPLVCNIKSYHPLITTVSYISTSFLYTLGRQLKYSIH
jgi:hypothetical protein